MWGFGGRYYWGRRERKEKVEGIVVVFAWMSSQDKHLKNYVDLYASHRWDSLVCHSQFLNLFFPDKAASMAQEIVNELVQEIKLRPRPVVFASFSGGPKACMYKVLQIIEGKCEEQNNLADYRVVRNCISGYIFDSTPVDFVSDLGTRFVLHPSILKTSRPPVLATWIAKFISSSLDALFLSRLESQRAEYWQTLYSTVSMGAPYLIFCSEDDELAPFRVVFNFATRLKNLGAEVDLVKWSSSAHVGHFRNYPEEYRAAVTELLGKAALIHSHKIRQLEVEKIGSEGPHNKISGPFSPFRKTAAQSNQSFSGNPIDSNGLEYHEDIDIGSVRGPPGIMSDGVLGRLLFDVCAPKDVEDWEVRSSARRHLHSNPMKCIGRSRL